MLNNQYGKLAGGSLGITIATAIVETADQYLAHPLPNSVVLAIAGILGLIGVYITPHNAIGGTPANSSEPASPVKTQGN